MIGWVTKDKVDCFVTCLMIGWIIEGKFGVLVTCLMIGWIIEDKLDSFEACFIISWIFLVELCIILQMYPATLNTFMMLFNVPCKYLFT